jgi:The ARF-like 2 binding protein BART
LLEGFIERSLSDRFGDKISLSDLLNLVENRQQEITGDVWDMLLSLSDFREFKETMLAHKKVMAAAAEAQPLSSRFASRRRLTSTILHHTRAHRKRQEITSVLMI